MEITLEQYASRMDIKLLRTADYNRKLREHDVPKEVTVLKICGVCRVEKDVRSVLDEAWKEPSEALEAISYVITSNEKIFEFEKLEN